MDAEVKRVPIRSYNKVWKIEDRIYAIQNIVLPVPVSPRQVGYFLLIAGVIFVVSMLLPLFSVLPSVIRFIAIPVALTQFLLKKKLDGKMPQRYFTAWLRYQYTRNQYIERFQEHPSKGLEKMRVDWCCTRGSIVEKGRKEGRRHDTVPN